MYRFLATRRWLGLAALMVAAAGVMVALGLWQLDRYGQRTAINNRIIASESAAPVPVTTVLPAPRPGGGTPPSSRAEWTRVTATGVYDPTLEVLARGRTVAGRVGYEVLTPLRLVDGSAVLVDRGWVPPAPGGARAHPAVPPAPTGPVTVVGRVHLSESRAGPVDDVDGSRQVRRIGVGQIAPTLPYPVFGAYLLLDTQDPAADERLVAVSVPLERTWQNAGYVVQWWLLAGLTLFGLGYLARREATGAGFDREVRDLADAAATRLPEAPVSPAR